MIFGQATAVNVVDGAAKTHGKAKNRSHLAKNFAGQKHAGEHLTSTNLSLQEFDSENMSGHDKTRSMVVLALKPSWLTNGTNVHHWIQGTEMRSLSSRDFMKDYLTPDFDFAAANY